MASFYVIGTSWCHCVQSFLSNLSKFLLLTLKFQLPTRNTPLKTKVNSTNKSCLMLTVKVINDVRNSSSRRFKEFIGRSLIPNVHKMLLRIIISSSFLCTCMRGCQKFCRLNEKSTFCF